MDRFFDFAMVVVIIFLAIVANNKLTARYSDKGVEMKLFHLGDVVTFSENYKAGGPDHFWLDSAGTPVTFAEVLDEGTSGTVEVYDPKTKVNRQKHRSYLQLKDPK